MTTGHKLIAASKEARALAPEVRTAKEAREDRATARRAAAERASRVRPVSHSLNQEIAVSGPLVEGEHDGANIGSADE